VIYWLWSLSFNTDSVCECNYAGKSGQLVTESDVAGMTQPGHPSVAGQRVELTLPLESGSAARETVGSSSDSAADLQ